MGETQDFTERHSAAVCKLQEKFSVSWGKVSMKSGWVHWLSRCSFDPACLKKFLLGHLITVMSYSGRLVTEHLTEEVLQMEGMDRQSKYYSKVPFFIKWS